MNTVEMLKKLGACEDGFEWLHRQGNITPMQAWTACPHGSSLVWLLMRVDYPSFQLISMLRNLIKPQVMQLRAGHLARTAVNIVDGWLHENVTLEEVKKSRIQVWASHEELIASITPERALPVQVADIHAIAAAGFLLDTVIDVARIEEAKKPRGPLLKTSEARLAAARSAHNTLWRGAEAAAAYAVAQVGPAKEVDPSPDPEQQPQTVVHIYEEFAGEGVEPTVQVTPLEKGRTQARFKSLPKKISDAVVTNLRKGHEVGRISSFQLNQTRDLQVLREVGVESIQWEKDTSKAVTVTVTTLRVDLPKVLEVLGASSGVLQEWSKQHAERMQKNRFTQQEFREAMKEERPKDNRTVRSLVEVPHGWDEETWGKHYTAVQTNRPYNEPAHPQNVAYHKALQDYADRLREQVKWSEVWDLLGVALGQKNPYL